MTIRCVVIAVFSVFAHIRILGPRQVMINCANTVVWLKFCASSSTSCIIRLFHLWLHRCQLCNQCFLLILALVFVFTLHTLYRALKCVTCGKIDNTMQVLHLTISVCVTALKNNLGILCIESSTFNMI